MKRILLFTLLLSITTLYAQDIKTDSLAVETNGEKEVPVADFLFDVTDTGRVNSKQNEFGSGFFQAKYIIISGRKIGGIGGAKDPLTGEPYTQIYCSTIKGTGDLESPVLYSRILNTIHNEGTITFTPDQETVYYTRSKQGDKVNYKLYRASDHNIEGKWANETEIHVSSDEYSIENPYLSRDGKLLYFASDMPGGYGGYDIYVSTVKNDTIVGDPINLGEEVNTGSDDKFPYLDRQNKYFYFSSKGHNTFGGFDIFRTRKVDDKYVRTLNLGTTINKPEDDIAFMYANEKRGYVSSSKPSKNGMLDVYKFRIDNKKQLLKGIVVDQETQKPIPNAEVKFVDIDGNVIGSKKVGSDARFSFYVDPYEAYMLHTKKEGFDPNDMPFESDSSQKRVFEVTVELEQTPAEIVEVKGVKMIKIENIYFDFDKSTIKPVSQVSLNKVVKVLVDNPDMKIEVNAHTDARGNNAYNLALSKRRAASTMRYLISKGIDSKRLVSEGYGETSPLYDCGLKCSEQEHDLNRRVEFVILK